MIKKIKNNTVSAKNYRGQEIAPAAYYEIDWHNERLFANDSVLQADVTSGDAIMNNGTSDITNATNGLAFLKAVNADCIAAKEVDNSSIGDGKHLSYDLTNDKLVYVDSYSAMSFTEGAGAELYPSSKDVWLTETLTGAPINSIVEVMCLTFGDAVDVGVRKVGSTLNRKVAPKKGSQTMTVKTNGSGQIEIYSSETSTTFQYWGTFN